MFVKPYVEKFVKQFDIKIDEIIPLKKTALRYNRKLFKSLKWRLKDGQNYDLGAGKRTLSTPNKIG